MGPEIKELEQNLAEYIGVKHTITCANRHGPFNMALMALDIGEGDAVFCYTLPSLHQQRRLHSQEQLQYLLIPMNTFNICRIYRAKSRQFSLRASYPVKSHYGCGFV